jgi:FAD/FMN-containing dehydrogenase
MGNISLACVDGGRVEVDDQLLENFRSNLRGRLLRPGDSDYDLTRKIWNGMFDKRPALIVSCRGVADIIASVNFARENRVLLAVRGGGHNVAGNASCDDGLMIDLSFMKGIWVDRGTAKVRVQGGATWGDVDRETQLFSLAIPGGVVSTTGVAGLTLGGGMGWQMRKRGLSIDNLISVEIVTADGELKVASAAENPDLFWAVRGGGGNFGVIASFEFQAHPVGPIVTLACPMYPADLGEVALRAWRDFMTTAPEECGGSFLFWSIPNNPFFPEEHHGKPIAIPLITHIGDLEFGERLLDPIRHLGTPLVDLSGPIPWTMMQAMFDPFVQAGALNYYWKSLHLASLDNNVVSELVEVATTIPSKNTYLVVLPLGGAFARVASDETAFGLRDMPFTLELDSMWPDSSEDELNIEWTRNTWTSLQTYSTGAAYLNFPGFGEDVENLVRNSVGANNYERLRQLKTLYDPTNLFRMNLNIKPSA